MDAEFGNKFTNLTSMSEIQDKSTLKLVFDSAASALPDGSHPRPYSTPATSGSGESSLSSGSLCDTDILSSPESTPSRSSGWPIVFLVPRFPYDCELQLDKANAAFKESRTLLNPDMRLKTAILDSLAEEIVQYSDIEFEEVAEALVSSHPCLKEPGSATGYGGWKVSLKYKLAHSRRKLKRLGCPEVELNSLTNKLAEKCSPAYGVKKPRRADVNYCPTYPSGESAETLEKIRETLLLELKKRNNEDTVAAMMEKTVAHRRQEVIRDAPLIADFKTRWPALFCVREITAEFKRITTVSLLSKFFSKLDALSSNLMKVFGNKGGVQGRKIRSIMIPITQMDAIDVRRECIIKALCVYLNEQPENLVKDYMNTDGESSEAAMMKTTFGIFVIRKEGAEPDVTPEDVGIVLEVVQVLDELGNVPLAVVMLFALVYALNLSYPPELRYTLGALQKIIMELDGNRLLKKKSNTKNSTCVLVVLNRVNYSMLDQGRENGQKLRDTQQTSARALRAAAECVELME
uniref:Sterile alpha motif domain-containing protein 3 n=1 Tax=Larimichthys crocea TaxID=215358 RepID=A0A0F8C9V8_LARCR